jgi:hypothetical protein
MIKTLLATPQVACPDYDRHFDPHGADIFDTRRNRLGSFGVDPKAAWTCQAFPAQFEQYTLEF